MTVVLKLIIGVVLVFIFCAAVLVLSYAIRMRKTMTSASFQCDYRPNLNSGWTAGFAVYGKENLDWYRLVSFRFSPEKTWSRRHFNTEKPVYFEGTVTVPVRADGHRFYLAMDEGNHSGLVSWSEAAPPISH